MSTLTIQIGNSDDKLTQREWANFVGEIAAIIAGYEPHVQTHFHATSANDMPWQNACWVIGCPDELRLAIIHLVKECRGKFRQDSAAITIGETALV